MIKIKHLYYKYDKRFFALFDFNLDIKDKQKIIFFSKNQLETFTLFRLLSKQNKDYKGEIYFNEKNLKQISLKELSISYITSNPYLLKFKSPIYNLAYPLLIRKIDKKIAYEKAENLLNKFNLDILKDKKIKDLTQAEKILITILRASISEKNIILIDDIFSNLDTKEFDKILQLISNLFADKTILISLTNLNLLEKFHSYTFIKLENGSICQY